MLVPTIVYPKTSSEHTMNAEELSHIVSFLQIRRTFEPAHEIMVLFVLRKLILEWQNFYLVPNNHNGFCFLHSCSWTMPSHLQHTVTQAWLNWNSAMLKYACAGQKPLLNHLQSSVCPWLCPHVPLHFTYRNDPKVTDTKAWANCRPRSLFLEE